MLKFVTSNILLITFPICIQSCRPVYEKVINDQYPKDETIHICDFLIFNQIQVGPFRGEYQSVSNFSDSIIGILTNSFHRLNNLKFMMHESKNAADSSYILKKYNGSFRQPPADSILVLAEKCNKSFAMIPVIDVFHRSAGSEGGPTYSDRARLTIFIVEHKEIIYAHSYVVVSRDVFAADINFEGRPLNLLTQKDWDELVEGAMQPYIDRLK